jgi:electron transport complex protein RnfA
MGIAVVFVIVFSALICYPIYHFVLVPADLKFMDTVVYILVIASLVQIVGLFIKKYSPALYKSLGIYLPLITTNCAVLGVVQENTDTSLTFAMSMANALGTSLGYLLMIFVFACIRTRLDTYNTPRAFKGIPIALITAAIMAMAMTGLTGIGA